MGSHSRWAQQDSFSSQLSPSSSTTPFSSSTSTQRRPTERSKQDGSFLWLSSSFNAEASGPNPLGAVDDFNAREFTGHGDTSASTGAVSSLRTTFGGKPSRTGYTKMASPTSPSHPKSSEASSSQPTPNPNANLAPPGADQDADAAKYRSSWTSTDSDKSDKLSISQSDFEFLTPSFIALDNPPVIGHDSPAQGGSRRGGNSSTGGKQTNGGLSVPGSQRVTGESHTLGRLHNMDRESSVLPPSSVRSEFHPAHLEHPDHLDAVAEQDATSGDEERFRNPLSPTQPLRLARKPSNQAKDSSQHQSTAANTQRSQTSPRYYHQPPPRQEESQQQLRHVRSTGTTSSADTAPSSSRQPLSSTRSHNQLSTGTTYPPTAFSSHLKRNESQSKTSYSAASGAGYIASASVSPSTSISVSLRDQQASGSGAPAATDTPAGSMTGMMAALSGGRSRSDSEGRHPYANSLAYRAAVTDDEDHSRAGTGYTSPGSRDQHPFASYRPTPHQAETSQSYSPSRAQLAQRQEEHYSRGSGYTSDGSGRAQNRYVVQDGGPSSSKPRSNVGHGRVSEAEDAGARRGLLAVPEATTKKEKRQSAISLRIRNIYPATRGSAPFSNTSAAPRPSSKNIPAEKQSQAESGEQDLDADWVVMKWIGIAILLAVVAGFVPLIGAVYGAAGHAILRAKATSDASSLPSGTVSDSVYVQAMITSTAEAGALGGAILAIPVLLVIFIAVGQEPIIEFKQSALKWMRNAASPPANDDAAAPTAEQEKQKAAERRRSRRASSLWGPNAVSISVREQSTLELATNVCVNVLLAILFLCLGSACTSLGVTLLSPSAPRFGPDRKVFLTTSTAALAGLVGGAIVFGGLVIIGGVLAWVIYEGGRPIPIDEQQLAVGSVRVQGVNVGVPMAANGSSRRGGGTNVNVSHGTTKSLGGSTFFGGQPTITSDEGGGPESDTGHPRWV